MSTPPGFVDLDRRFSVLDGTAPSEESAQRSYLHSAHYGVEDLHWPDLLAQRLIVILGEPGSGKSWELRHAAAVSKQPGQETFYVEIEQLVSRPLSQVLSPEDLQRFRKWRRSNRQARFFLDSVDEAKLRRAADFRAALDAICSAIDTRALDRASFVISSRISEWQPDTDRSEVLARLALPSFVTRPDGSSKDSPEDKAPILIVQIEPLSRDQVRSFVSAKGIADADRFVAAIEEHHAWDFARRPVDVVSLVEFWQANDRLGTLTEIIEFDVGLKLRETTSRQRDFPLTEADARLGAETLAAATLLCQEIRFKVPDEAFVGFGAIDVARCLPADWTPDKCAALISRPLFDSATYGTVRFHHRRVAEYLAAAWLRNRMVDGCPTQVLLHLLFDENQSEKSARQSLIPVTAWLCAGSDPWNREVRSAVLATAPEMHLQYGDAEALPEEYRRAVLRALVDRNKGRDRVWIDLSPDAARRLATPDLASDITELLQSPDTSADLRSSLVLLIRFGELQECIETLLELLSSTAPDDDLQVYVLAAMRDMGTEECLRQARAILGARVSLPDDISGIACEALYPAVIGPKDLASLFAKTQTKSQASTHLSWTVEQHFQEFMPADQAGEVLLELNKLAQHPPHVSFNGKETRISASHMWILDVIPTVLLRLLRNNVLTEQDCNAAAEAIALLSESRNFPDLYSKHVDEIDAATREHPEVRRAFFWQAVSRWRSEGATGKPSSWLFFDHSGVMSPSASDTDWLIKDVTQASDRADRELCLKITLQLGAARSSRNRRLLRQAVSSDDDLARLIDRAASEERWRWARRLWFQWSDSYRWQDRLSTLKFKMKRAWASLRFKWLLMRRLRLIRTGQSLGLLSRLSREANDIQRRWAATNWDTLASKRGVLVANAVKRGCKRAFQNLPPPPLPHERAKPAQVDGSVIVGLVGVQALVDDHELDFPKINDAQVRLATRYALNEMNGFPEWLSDLGKARPHLVVEVLDECVRGEWDYPPDREHVYDVLADLAWEGGELAQLVRDTVIELFHERNPGNRQILQNALEVLVKTTVPPDTDVAALAVERCRAEPDIVADAFILWAAVSLQFDADQGVTILENRTSESDAAADVLLRICNTLSGEVRQRLPVLPQPDYLRPAALQKLIPLLFRHVRPEEDIDRRGMGPYTPTARDQACRFRDGLLVRLSESEAPDAAEVLRELSEIPELAARRDWMLHLIDERARKDSDFGPWSPTDVRTFAAKCKTDSINAGIQSSPSVRPDLLIVTVNEHETHAVMDGFRGVTDREAVVVQLDGQVYHELGLINGTQVFHVISEMGSGGVGGMQQTVDKAIRSLRPGAIVAVGIAFGVNEKNQTIGDILLSKQLSLYELQRVSKDRITLRGARPDASQRLVSHFKTFGQTKWKGAPFRSGLILSGEKLVDNIDYRSQLLLFESEAIGGEMEGAGLYVPATEHKVDWIVLKAICDFADGKKGEQKEERQSVAARNAVRFLIEALQFAPLKHMD